MKFILNLILLIAAIHAASAGCRRWLGKCTQNSDCCNNRRCMKWGRCSLVHRGSGKVYKCFNDRNELKNAVKSYREGNDVEKERVKGIYGDSIGKWCVDYVTDFESVFDVYDNERGFNEDISRWNTSSVTNMKYMFYGQSDFNQDISRWDVSKVTDMTSMFYNTISFNKNLSSWDVSKVTTMERMFLLASIFNQDISSWDVTKVTSFRSMFFDATAFKTNLCHWRDKIITTDDTSDIFVRTSCPNQNDPVFDGIIIRNMCHDCV
jgi:surface protein